MIRTEQATALRPKTDTVHRRYQLCHANTRNIHNPSALLQRPPSLLQTILPAHFYEGRVFLSQMYKVKT
jgi:hypothetical protein